MSYSKSQIIQRALRIATMAGGDANSSLVIDNKVVVEDLFYQALRQAVEIGAKNPVEVGSLKRDFTITVTNGVGGWPDDILDGHTDGAAVYSKTDDTISQLTSWCPRYLDYIRPTYSQLGYFTVQGANFLFKEAGGDINHYNGDVHIVAIAVPEISSFTGAITIATETAERTILYLSQMLKGSLPTE